MSHHLVVPAGAAPQRLDLFLATALVDSRSRIQQMLRSGAITVNGAPARPSYLVQPNDAIAVLEATIEATALLAPLELPVVYEDSDLLVVDKPAGLVVHPATAAHAANTPSVAGFARTKTTDPDPERPGIVHRLDRDTSGLLIIAKDPAAKAALQRAFRTRAVAKTYQLLVVGTPKEAAAVINLPLGRDPARPLRRMVSQSGREALTGYRTLAVYPGFSFMEAKPQTGRTHQLRVHFAAIGHPVAGDITYGPPTRPLGLTRQFLHAAALEFTTPSGKFIELHSPLPPDLASVLHTLENQS